MKAKIRTFGEIFNRFIKKVSARRGHARQLLTYDKRIDILSSLALANWNAYKPQCLNLPLRYIHQ
jgi:hypothetical protein